MSIESKTNLNESTIEGLQKLIRYNIDACNGFLESAEVTDQLVVSELFRKIADQRSDFAETLRAHVEISGEKSQGEGSLLAAVHRAWIDVRAAINDGEALPVLREAERGEDFLKTAYQDVLKETAGSAVNDVLIKQYAMIKQGHDEIRNLSERLKSAKTILRPRHPAK